MANALFPASLYSSLFVPSFLSVLRGHRDLRLKFWNWFASTGCRVASLEEKSGAARNLDSRSLSDLIVLVGSTRHRLSRYTGEDIFTKTKIRNENIACSAANLVLT